jgi:hypothetical protein
MRVEWVHPTWRDLVISQLAGDAQSRRRFLRRCGVYGIELALSTEGGSRGERQLPLIGCDADWDAVTDRLFELVSELEPTELLALLATLAQAAQQLRETADGDEAQAMARTVLGRIASLWDSAHAPIPLAQLAAWLELGRCLEPHPQTPRLSITWCELLPASVPDPSDRAAVERFADWLVLCELLWDYDPELREALGFCDEQAALMANFIGQVELRKSVDRPVADQVLRTLDAIGLLAPELRSLASFVSRGLIAPTAVERRPSDREPEPSQLEVSEVRRVLLDL